MDLEEAIHYSFFLIRDKLVSFVLIKDSRFEKAFDTSLSRDLIMKQIGLQQMERARRMILPMLKRFKGVRGYYYGYLESENF